MKIGFTGTQVGMTDKQYNEVYNIVNKLVPEEAHMGDCVGADTEFYEIVYEITNTHGHIPDKDNKRSKLKYDVEYEPKPYLDRNHDIVDACDILIATPKEKEEQLRSGTWATIRYAKKKNKKIVIVYPDGKLERFG